MKAERLVAAAPVAAFLMFLVCGACGQPRTPEALGSDADAGELTCEEKIRVQLLCRTALHDRCTSQSNQCDLGCGAPGGQMVSASDTLGQAAPDVAEFKTTQCRDNCRHGLDGCEASIAQRCPVLCQ